MCTVHQKRQHSMYMGYNRYIKKLALNSCNPPFSDGVVAVAAGVQRGELQGQHSARLTSAIAIVPILPTLRIPTPTPGPTPCPTGESVEHDPGGDAVAPHQAQGRDHLEVAAVQAEAAEYVCSVQPGSRSVGAQPIQLQLRPLPLPRGEQRRHLQPQPQSYECEWDKSGNNGEELPGSPPRLRCGRCLRATSAEPPAARDTPTGRTARSD